jgi:hypothetical protein
MKLWKRILITIGVFAFFVVLGTLLSLGFSALSPVGIIIVCGIIIVGFIIFVFHQTGKM